MTRIKEEILQKAAKHKLHIQFHGSEKPTGLSRTYPNEFTREGTLNYEVNTNGIKQ
jgi:alpha-glucosidase